MMLALWIFNFLSFVVLEMFPNFPYLLIDLIIMFVPTVGYMDTVRLMISSKSPAAYSLQTTMILNVGQGLKVLYFFYHRYAISIFGQCLTQIGAATLMSFLKFKYSPHESDEASFISRIPKLINIGNARTFMEYLTSLLIYSIVTYAIFLSVCPVLGVDATAGAVGIIGNLVESLVSVPTFVKIVIRKDINNVSTILILQYIFGDIMKIGLFIITKSPFSFFLGAFCQLSLDSVLFVTFLKLLFCQGKEKRPRPSFRSEGMHTDAEELMLDVGLKDVDPDGIEEEEFLDLE